MALEILPRPEGFAAEIRGVDLCQPVDAATEAALRAAWLAHPVLAFPDQPIDIPDLERFALMMGPRSEDPYIRAIPNHPHVVQVKREADETTPIFADNWHSDWSFLPKPPAGTTLYGNVIPPIGGDTFFANQYAAWEGLPAALRTAVEGRQGVHSARRGYSPEGRYGLKDKGRSMDIIYSDTAMKTRTHPVGRVHTETGRTALYVSPAYTLGIEGLPQDESDDLMRQLFEEMARPEYVYRHQWQQGTLLLWDNRCLVHAASGGYEGHRRLLHRITIADRTLVQ